MDVVALQGEIGKCVMVPLTIGTALRTFHVAMILVSFNVRGALFIDIDGNLHRINNLIPLRPSKLPASLMLQQSYEDYIARQEAQPVTVPAFPILSAVAVSTDVKHTCSICYSDYFVKDMVQCDDHSFCFGCIDRYVDVTLAACPVSDKLPCPLLCGRHISWKALSSSLSDEKFESVCKHFTIPPAPVQNMDDVTAENDIQYHADKMKDAMKRCYDYIDTLKTPCCSTAFMDFDACFSLSCPSCPKYFCAWCLSTDSVKDTSAASHEHVRNCPENPRHGDVFGSIAVWREDIEAKKKIHKRSKRENLIAICNQVFSTI